MGALKKFLDSNLKYFLLFLFVSCFFNYRAFTEGILLAPYNDALAQNYSVKHLYSSALKSLNFPFWNPYEFAGMPFFSEIQYGTLYPPNLILYSILNAPLAYNLNYILHFALAGFFTFLYVRLIGIKKFPAFTAGIVFGFSGFLATNKDHTAIVNSAVYLPLIMYFFEKLRRTLELRYSLLLALAIAVQVFAGNFQICVYTYLVAGFFLIFYSIKPESPHRGRFFILGVSGILLGIFIALPQILATTELFSLSWMRARKLYLGYEYFTGYHVYWEMLSSLIFPRLFEGWSPESGMSILIGILPLVLSVVIFTTGRKINSHIKFWGIVGLIGIFLSLGGDNPVYRLLYHVPVFNKIRAHGRNIFEFTFAVSVLSGFGIERLLYEKQKDYIKYVSFGLISAILLATGLVLSFQSLELKKTLISHLLSRGYQNPYLADKALSIENKFVYIPLVLMFLYLFWTYVYEKFKRPAMIYLLLVLIFLELFSLGGLQKTTGPKLSEAANLCSSEPYYKFTETDKEIYRIANIIPRELWWEVSKYNPTANLTCKTSSLTGYDPLFLEKYGDILNLWLAGLGSISWDYLINNNVILSMLGGKYLKISKEMNLNVDDVKASASAPSRTKMPSLDWTPSRSAKKHKDTYILFSPGGKDIGLIYKTLNLAKGAYAISFKAKAPEGAEGYLGVYLYPASEVNKISALRDLDSKLLIPADWLEKQYRDFHQVIKIDKSDTYTVFIITIPERPVEIKDLSMEKFEHYNPPILNTHVKDEDFIYKKISETEDYNVYLNKNYLPRAWSIAELIPVNDFYEAKRKLDFLEINLKDQAIIYKNDIDEIRRKKFSKGKVSIKKYGLNEIVISADFPDEGFVVLSDQYYPGWKAFIDGKETRIYEVNGLLRGIVVPQGKHSVIFRYRPHKILFFMTLSLFLTALTIIYIAVKKPKV